HRPSAAQAAVPLPVSRADSSMRQGIARHREALCRILRYGCFSYVLPVRAAVLSPARDLVQLDLTKQKPHRHHLAVGCEIALIRLYNPTASLLSSRASLASRLFSKRIIFQTNRTNVPFSSTSIYRRPPPNL